ncbi:hypothetical protein F5Y00DRAFT_224649 [Daldinia vernicosa]|uniref:uncharacterized protein n=1 Tax=Daldinia vernicosa TaxID=114800 RepID=UPI002007E936|nr:uncharacterized protein F5Y00DRAFT_224649 [Daldinia vernicosa]KAI0853418.1 hypothetical protein F5Y00DRAFT_224649 [Daldinia vernicosa]
MILPCLLTQLLLLNPWDSLGIENATHASSLARSTADIHYFLLGIGSTRDSSECKMSETRTSVSHCLDFLWQLRSPELSTT